MQQNTPPHYFLHLPKAAGTSLNAWLSARYAPDRVFPHVDPARVKAMGWEEVQGYDYYAGHFDFGFVEQLGFRPRVITWLRDPARRLLSSYHYLRGLDDGTMALMSDQFARAQCAAARSLSFEDWVHLPQEGYFIHDFMAQSLAGPAAWGDGVLPQAIENLEAFEHVGLVERMQESVDLLCYRLRWLPEEFTIELNTNRGSRAAELSETAREIIRERDAVDYAVYEHARALVERRLVGMREALELPPPGAGGSRDEVSGALRRWFRAANAAALPAAPGWLPLEGPLVGSGWMRPMWGRGSPAPRIRWSGPGCESEFFANLSRDRDLQVTFTVLGVMNVEVLRSMHLGVNGVNIPLRIEPAPREHYPHAHRFRGRIGVGALQAEEGLARLVFRISRTFPEPVASEPAKGPKQLGFILDGIQIDPAT